MITVKLQIEQIEELAKLLTHLALEGATASVASDEHYWIITITGA